ncbi:FtsQ-type POTRA domain-containing protein [Nakamurella sp. YIM 132087]|uniref:FtsQ-type POTRA domain-containing protein n=1 Tax=Nakamurella alba TaxID=2665158 RepID=A0A7K1FSZ2_9ACTN|nr:FtsQ-type POTRA domain-containing protein [Nakamurella alba]MTD16509.1 FtsQ-type POTRA domain-containing protein [Nakamurella alba]
MTTTRSPSTRTSARATARTAATTDAEAAPRRRRWPYVLVASILVLVCAGAGYVFFFSPLLGLRTVTVAGADADLTGQIRAAVDLPDGTPLARIDLSQVQDRVEDVPQVAAATVTRAWPDGLVVTVRSRTPVAVTSANGRTWLLDSSGVAYERVATVPAGMVTVNLATPAPGDPATEAALTVIGAMTADFRETVASVTARSAYDLSVTLKDKRVVFWGGTDRSARKMQILPALLERPGKTFDVSDPDLVTVR